MNGLFQEYHKEYLAYEHNFPLAFPWTAPEKEDVPRYVLGEDGFWYDPTANANGKAVLSCVGDLMCEPAMTNACRFGDAYFFHPLFRYVRPILKNSDFSVANLETLIGNASPYAGEYHRVNGCHFGEKMDAITDYVRKRVGNALDFLHTARVTLGQVCNAMGAVCPPEKETHPVMGLAAQVGSLEPGGLYFSNGDELLYAKREVGRRHPVAVVCREPMEGFHCILVPDVAKAYALACACIRPLCHPTKPSPGNW